MIYEPKLPSKWTADLAYLFGLLLGDGSLPKARSLKPNKEYQERYLIYFFSNDKEFVYNIYLPLFKNLFCLEPRIEVLKRKNFPLYACKIESKKLYGFLKKRGFTIGKKAKIATIPKLPRKYYVHLLAGLLDTDGGKKGNGFGLSTASEYLALFCMNTFKELGLSYNSCPWHHNNHVYHQVYIPGGKMQKLLKYVPLKNQRKIAYIQSYNASVA